RMVRPNTANTPAAVPTTAPRTSLVTFSVISALASSISSRTSRLARSGISLTAVAIWGPASGFPGSGAKALDQEGEGDAAQERGADEDLGGQPLPLVGGDAGDRRSGLERGQPGLLSPGAVS